MLETGKGIGFELRLRKFSHVVPWTVQTQTIYLAMLTFNKMFSLYLFCHREHVGQNT